MELNQAEVEFEIADPFCIVENRNNLFQYDDRKYLANRNNQKYYYYGTNCTIYLCKRMASITEKRHAIIKQAFDSRLKNLPEVMRVIRKKIEE